MKRINSKEKGRKYENKLCNELREFFPDIASTRAENRTLDGQGVDFVNTDVWRIQAKATERTPAYSELLQAMPGPFPAVFHKRNRKRETVTLLKDDFYHILRALKALNKNILLPF